MPTTQATAKKETHTCHCGNLYGTAAELRRHETNGHPERLCQICKTQQKDAKQLLIHQRYAHIDNFCLKCDECHVDIKKHNQLGCTDRSQLKIKFVESKSPWSIERNESWLSL
jgi:hypothetical protein